MSKSLLIIQTSFLGDVILATAMVEKLHAYFPDVKIDMLVKKGNDSVLQNNPYLNKVILFEKNNDKYANLFRLIKKVRDGKYYYVINLHRYASSGLITMLSGAKFKIGFHSNPFSFSYTHKFRHEFNSNEHEVDRNQKLISFLTDSHYAMPKIYPSNSDFDFVKKYQSDKYICISPGSVWATKRLPLVKWIELCNRTNLVVYILGAPNEQPLADEIIAQSSNTKVVSLCRELTLLQSAALLKGSEMNYVNDSAPLHLCSAMNAPCTAFFCSTIPEFGFGPLSTNAKVIQTEELLKCKPCGIHGKSECPEGHFKCGFGIDINKIILE